MDSKGRTCPKVPKNEKCIKIIIKNLSNFNENEKYKILNFCIYLGSLLLYLYFLYIMII